jgi:enoyl-CoA hydratase
LTIGLNRSIIVTRSYFGSIRGGLVEQQVIEYEVSDHVARVWLNRPHKRNAVSDELLDRLYETIETADADPEVRVIVLRGRGGTFSSGYDLDELKADFLGSSRAIDVAYKSARVCNRLYNTRKPVVAVLEGYVTAGGFEIMISCDFAVASTEAKIGDFHIRRGLLGGAGPIYRLPRMIGIRKAKELMLTGKLLDGREAKEWNLVNVVAEPELLEQSVEDFVGQLADKSPFTLWITKMTVDRSLDADTESLLVMEHLAVGNVLQSEDAREGVTAFLEKRQPKWVGR